MANQTTKGYTLPELPAIDIDAWVNGISHLAERYGGEVEGYDMASSCPAEFEEEFTEVAERHGVRFDGHGNVI